MKHMRRNCGPVAPGNPASTVAKHGVSLPFEFLFVGCKRPLQVLPLLWKLNEEFILGRSFHSYSLASTMELREVVMLFGDKVRLQRFTLSKTIS